MRIGIIDSGKGGLAVAKKIKKKEDQLLILLDQGFFPYGTKSKEFLFKLKKKPKEYLLKL